MQRERILIISYTALFLFLISVCFERSQTFAMSNYTDDMVWLPLMGNSVMSHPEIKIIQYDETGFTMEFMLNGICYNENFLMGELFHEIGIPGCQVSQKTGKPALPVNFSMIGLPQDNIKPEISVESATFKEISGFNVFPSQTPTFDGAVMGDIDRDFYNKDIYYPENTVCVSSDAHWRNIPVRSIGIAPVQFNPHNKTLRVFDRIVIRVNFNQDDDQSTDLSPVCKYIPESFDSLFRDKLLNYEQLSLIKNSKDRGFGTEYLILTYPLYETVIELLAEWHRKQGFRTEVVTINTSNPDNIKNIIQDRYEDGELEYVALVGNVQQIPQKNWDGILSDHWYACLTGDPPDFFADIAIGRYCVNDVADLGHQLTKFFKYESDPPVDDWVNRILFVAHSEGAPGKYQGCKNYIREMILSGLPLTITQINGSEPSGKNQAVESNINAGVGTVNYRGHGTQVAWQNWDYYGMNFQQANVRNLVNGDYTPVVFNVCCLNGSINGNSLLDTWLDANYAAVAALGATAPSWYLENNTFDQNLYYALYQETAPIYDIGNLLNYANSSIAHTSNGQDNVRMYLWLGDPATEIWTDVPGSLTVTHESSFQVGLTSVSIKVSSGSSPVKEAQVCFYKDDGTLFKGRTNSSGMLLMDVVFYSTGNGYVTVTKHNYLPYSALITVAGVSPDIGLELTPEKTVLKKGEVLKITAQLFNNSSKTQGFDAWTEVILPNGKPYPDNPVAGQQFVRLPANKSMTQIISHKIPSSAVTGIYTYKGNLGGFNGTVWAEDSFTFEIIP